MKHFNADRTIARGRRNVREGSSVGHEAVSDPKELANILSRNMGRLSALEGSQALEVAEYEVVCPYNSTIVLAHGFNGPIRWYVTSWKRKSYAGPWALTEVEFGGSDANTLVLYSQVPGRAVIRIERQQASLQRDDTVRTLIAPGGIPIAEIVFGAESTTATATYTRLGARKLDLSLFPTVTAATFKVDLESVTHSSAWYARARVFDITNNVVLTSSTLDNSGETDRSLVNEFSAALTLGTTSGTLRTNANTEYSVQFQVTGTITDVTTQRAVIGNARIVLS